MWAITLSVCLIGMGLAKVYESHKDDKKKAREYKLYKEGEVIYKETLALRNHLLDIWGTALILGKAEYIKILIEIKHKRVQLQHKYELLIDDDDFPYDRVKFDFIIDNLHKIEELCSDELFKIEKV